MQEDTRGARIVGKTYASIERLVEDYLADAGARLSPKTVRNSYGYPLREVFLPWCRREAISDPDELTTALLNRLMVNLRTAGGKRGQLAEQSVWTYGKAVGRFIAWANDPDGGGIRIEARVRLPRLQLRRDVDILTRDECARIEAAATNERDRLIVRLLADTGIRVGELASLRLTSYAERGRELFLRVRGKGGERRVPLQPQLYRRLKRYATAGRPQDALTDRLFVAHARSSVTGRHEPLQEWGIRHLIRDLGEKAAIGRRVHPHLFRHSAATFMLQRRMNPLMVADILGHSDLTMIQKVYAHLSDTDRHSAYLEAYREGD